MRPSSIAALALACLLAFGLGGGRPVEASEITADIEWKSWADMQSFDYAANDKPIMYFFHKSWCGACKKLVQTLNENGKEVEAAAKDFVMVNILDDDAGTDIPPEFLEDGAYIPRIYFADSNGKVSNVKNDMGNPKFKYFYTHAFEVEKGMRNALRSLKKQPKDEL